MCLEMLPHLRGAFPRIGSAAASQTILYGWYIQMWHAIVTYHQPRIRMLFSENCDYNRSKQKEFIGFFPSFKKFLNPFTKCQSPWNRMM